MLIPNTTAANQLLASPTTLNPSFFGVVHNGGSVTPISSTITPPPYKQVVTVQPPAIPYEITVSPPPAPYTSAFTPPPIKDSAGNSVPVPPFQQSGEIAVPSFKTTILVTPAAFQQEVTVQPAPVAVTAPGESTTHNLYEAVGIVEGPPLPLRLLVLVRPNVVLGAHHYNNSPYPAYVGMTVRFIGSSGYEDRKITSVALTKGDLECYYLDQAVTVVKPCPISTLSAAAMGNTRMTTFGLVGSRNSASGWQPAAATNVLGRVTPDASTGNWAATCQMLTLQLEPGDSGSPSFCVAADGSPTVLGSTFKISSTYQVNVATPWVSAINSL